MPKVTEEYAEAQRQRVLDAALTCFGRKGFHETTMKDISREAGVSYGVAYHYFPNKEEIFAAAADLERGARSSAYDEAERGVDTRDSLNNLMRYRIARGADPERQIDVNLRVHIHAESARNPRLNDEFRQGVEELLRRFSAVVRRGHERREVNPDVDPVAMAQVLLAIHDGLLAQKSTFPEMDVNRFLDAVIVLLNCNLWTNQEAAVAKEE